MARPTKLTPEVEERLVYAISVGGSYKAACQYAGISYQTFLNWRKRVREGAVRQDGERCRETEEGNERFVELFDHINKAEGDAAIVWLVRIEKAAKRDWKAAAWKLERRFPREYGRYALASSDPDEVPFQPGTQQEIPPEENKMEQIAKILLESGVLLPQSGTKDRSVGNDAEFAETIPDEAQADEGSDAYSGGEETA